MEDLFGPEPILSARAALQGKAHEAHAESPALGEQLRFRSRSLASERARATARIAGATASMAAIYAHQTGRD
eukprot:5055205-Prymnesium_polylepis.1